MDQAQTTRRQSGLTADTVPTSPPVQPERLVRSLYRALGLRDLRLFGSMLADDITWVGAARRVATDKARAQPEGILGRDAVLSYLAHLIERSGGTYSVRLQRLYLHSPDRVVAFEETTLPSGSVRTRCVLFEVEAGLVRRAVRLDPAASGPIYANDT